MSFWDGTQWVREAELREVAPSARTPRPQSALAVVLALGLVVLLQTGVFAASKTGATLGVVFSTASPNGSVEYGTPYTVTGCGYDAANGGVTVVVESPEAISFAGQIPDADGCIAVTNFSTQGPGTYSLTSYQTIRHKSHAMAKLSLTLP